MTPLWRWAALAALALALVMGVLWRRAAAAGREQALRADSLEVAADTTRELLLRAAGDNRVFQERAFQEKQRADALDRELGLTRVALVNMSASVVALAASVRAPVTVDSLDTRRATFDVRQAPYTARAAVALPRPPGEGSLDLSVTLDTAAIDLRLGCGERNAFGVRPASVTATTPPWLAVRFGRTTQAVEVCSTPTRKAPWWVYPLTALSFLGGVLVAK